MIARILVRSLGVIALISSVMAFGIGGGQAQEGRRPGRSTPQARALADRALAAEARSIDRASVGETRVAMFLGAEFDMTEKAITVERDSLAASWGNLTIAHTFAFSDKPGMTVAQVIHLHDLGMGWGQVAAGLHFKLVDAVNAVNAESRVARGRETADGRTARIGGDGL